MVRDTAWIGLALSGCDPVSIPVSISISTSISAPHTHTHTHPLFISSIVRWVYIMEFLYQNKVCFLLPPDLPDLQNLLPQQQQLAALPPPPPLSPRAYVN